MKTHTSCGTGEICARKLKRKPPPKTPRLAHQITRILTAQLAYLKTRQAAAECATDPEPA